MRVADTYDSKLGQSGDWCTRDKGTSIRDTDKDNRSPRNLMGEAEVFLDFAGIYSLIFPHTLTGLWSYVDIVSTPSTGMGLPLSLCLLAPPLAGYQSLLRVDGWSVAAAIDSFWNSSAGGLKLGEGTTGSSAIEIASGRRKRRDGSL